MLAEELGVGQFRERRGAVPDGPGHVGQHRIIVYGSNAARPSLNIISSPAFKPRLEKAAWSQARLSRIQLQGNITPKQVPSAAAKSGASISHALKGIQAIDVDRDTIVGEIVARQPPQSPVSLERSMKGPPKVASGVVETGVFSAGGTVVPASSMIAPASRVKARMNVFMRVSEVQFWCCC